MIIRILAAALTACLLLAVPAFAQSSDVTFQVPLNLTQLSADISKVSVTCVVLDPNDTNNGPLGRWNPSSTLFGNSLGLDPRAVPIAGGVWGVNTVEVPAVGGKVVTTKTVAVTVTDTQTWHQADHIGNALTYVCYLQGFSGSSQNWDFFAETQTNNVFRLSPSPEPLLGNFTW